MLLRLFLFVSKCELAWRCVRVAVVFGFGTKLTIHHLFFLSFFLLLISLQLVNNIFVSFRTLIYFIVYVLHSLSLSYCSIPCRVELKKRVENEEREGPQDNRTISISLSRSAGGRWSDELGFAHCGGTLSRLLQVLRLLLLLRFVLLGQAANGCSLDPLGDVLLCLSVTRAILNNCVIQ